MCIFKYVYCAKQNLAVCKSSDAKSAFRYTNLLFLHFFYFKCTQIYEISVLPITLQYFYNVL